MVYPTIYGKAPISSGLRRRPDGVEVTTTPQGTEVGLPVDLHFGRHQHEPRRAGKILQLGIVGSTQGAVRTEISDLSGLEFGTGKHHDAAALVLKVQRHVHKASDTDYTNTHRGHDTELEHQTEQDDAAAEQRRRLRDMEGDGQRYCP